MNAADAKDISLAKSPQTARLPSLCTHNAAWPSARAARAEQQTKRASTR